jgi:integrase
MASSSERVVRRRLADGTVKEYRYARDRPKVSRIAPGSIDALINAYKRSPEWLSLKPATHKNYAHYLRDLDHIGHVPVAAVRRRLVLSLRDAISSERGKGAANVFMRVTATLFRWARDRDWIEHSPIDRIRQLPGGHLLAWTSDEADRAMAELPAELARVVIVARYTGQRRGDLIGMTWRQYDGHAIRLVQEKGRQSTERAPVVIPAHPVLKAALDDWRRSATGFHILTSRTGQPWTRNHLTHEMRTELKRLGMRPGLNVHGLRKLAATALAEAGCTTHEIAAVTGHKSLAMVQLYTASAAQERMAEAAIIRLKTAPVKDRQTGGK